MTHLTSAAGNLIESYRYDAFGAPIIYDASGAIITATAYNNRFLFTGREYVAIFGFYEYRARAYHPGLGRFMSEDPKLFDAGDYNLYRYVHNDPLDMTDPMGTWGGTGAAEMYLRRSEEYQLRLLDRILAARELAGLSSTYGRALQSAEEGQMQRIQNEGNQ